jgi:hypothetical protein
MKFVMNARPHPNPLPRGEGTVAQGLEPIVRYRCNHRVFVRYFTSSLNTSNLTCDGRAFLPLLGERAGVRVVVTFSN